MLPYIPHVYHLFIVHESTCSTKQSPGGVARAEMAGMSAHTLHGGCDRAAHLAPVCSFTLGDVTVEPSP